MHVSMAFLRIIPERGVLSWRYCFASCLGGVLGVMTAASECHTRLPGFPCGIPGGFGALLFVRVFVAFNDTFIWRPSKFTKDEWMDIFVCETPDV